MTDEANKPVLDQQTFEKLLEAAYVLQQHHRKMRELEESLESQSENLREQERANQALQESKPESDASARAKDDYTVTLAEIVEAQHQIQMRNLDLDKAVAVVAERVARITGASGAGIGILDGASVCYRAGAGPSALPVGTEVPLQTAVCQANIRTGQVIRTEDMGTEFLFDPGPCRERGILSLLAVPIHYDGNIVGGLELYFDRTHGFAEQDIHTCQLMAGLVTEAIGRDAELKIKQSMAAERTSMLATIERLKPTSRAMAQGQSGSAASASLSTSAETAATSSCWECGTQLIADEQYCGKCGAPRAGYDEASIVHKKTGSAWQSQKMVAENGAFAPPNGDHPFVEETVSDSAIEEWNEVDGERQENGEGENAGALSATVIHARQEEVVWSSAEKAREFLESLSATRSPGALARFWRSRRGDFYLGVALIFVVVVIRWGIWSDSSVVATGHGGVAASPARSKRPAPDADLSTFDKLLIGLGLAEAPDEPVQYKGNPDTQVWIDLHTALYYCPGSDLYGKTPKGRISSQRDALLDQFEPANRKACE